MQQFAAARLLTTGRDATSAEEQLDVAHEALIRGWPRLRSWLDEDRDALRTQRRWRTGAEEWRRLGVIRRAAAWRAAGSSAEAWAKAYGASINAMEREFLEASMALREQEAAERQRAAEERERNASGSWRLSVAGLSSRFRRLAVVLAVAVIARLQQGFPCVEPDAGRQNSVKTPKSNAEYAEAQGQEAEEQRRIADRRSQEARARQLAAQSTAYLQQSRPPQLSLLLAVEAVSVWRTEDDIPPIAAAEEAACRISLPTWKTFQRGA